MHKIFILVNTMSKKTFPKEKALPNINMYPKLKIDKKLSIFLNEGKAAIEEFMRRKSKRSHYIINEKRKIKFKRMAEYFDALEKKTNDDIALEKIIRISNFEERVELIALNKQLFMENGIEQIIPLSEDIISLNEESEVNDRVDDNIMANGGKSPNDEHYLHLYK